MNKHLVCYLKSFDLDGQFWKTFLLDLITIGLILVIFFSFTGFLNMQAEKMNGGLSSEELKVQLLEGSGNFNQEYLNKTRAFALIFSIGSILVILGTLFLFSYSRKLVWQVYTNKKSKYWKWNWVSLILILASVIYFLLVSVIELLINMIFNITNQVVYFYFSKTINSIFLFIYLIFMFFTFIHFNSSYKVWASFNSAFKLIRRKWPDLWMAFLFIMLTAGVYSFITYFIQKAMIYQPEVRRAVVSGIVLLFLIAWMRKYIFSVVKE